MCCQCHAYVLYVNTELQPGACVCVFVFVCVYVCESETSLKLLSAGGRVCQE